jgi:hypothetical protein
VLKLKRNIILLVFLFSYFSGSGQSELVTWNSVQLVLKSSHGFDIAIKPTIRHNKNLKNYDNSSVDIIIAKSISKNWKAQFLIRNFWIDEGPNRYFWFFDVAHVFNITEKLNFRNGLRWHLAHDYLIMDPDFLRYQPKLSYTLSPKLSTFIMHDWFFRLNGIGQFQRVRYEAGANYKISPNTGLGVQYWYDTQINTDNKSIMHTIVSTLTYTFN